MDLIFDTALDQWHDWESTQTQWLLLDDTYTPDQVAQVWVSDVTGHELSVANYQRQPVTGRTRSVDVAQHRVTYGCDDPDFGYIAAGSQGLSMMCLAKVGVDDSSSLLLAAFDLPNIGSGLELQPLVSPSGVYWIAPVEPDTYTLTFRAPPAGVPAGAQSAFLSVPGATEVTTITWENLPPGVVNVYSEAFGTEPWTTLTSPPPSGSMDLPTGTLVTDGPTRISMIPTMPLGAGAKVELTVLGAGAPQETPPDAPWTPEGGWDYWLYAGPGQWDHYEATWGDVGRSNRSASFTVPTEAWVDGITVHLDGPASLMELTAKLANVDGTGRTFDCVLPGTSISWSFDPVEMSPNPDGSDIYGHGGTMFELNIWETGASITGGPMPIGGSTVLRAEVHLTSMLSEPPAGWRGSAANPTGWQDDPIQVI